LSPCASDEAPFNSALSPELPGPEVQRTFNEALAAHPSYGARYTACRFAFGKRLHGWLPFLAFDRPAAFVGMQARRGMPRDYFGDDTFLCAVPRRNPMSQAQLDATADGMIGKLASFVEQEDALVAQVAERREELWAQLQRQARAFADALT